MYEFHYNYMALEWHKKTLKLLHGYWLLGDSNKNSMLKYHILLKQNLIYLIMKKRKKEKTKGSY